MKFLLISVFCLVVIASPVRGETYKFDPAHSKIAFQLRHLLGTARGEFHKFTGTINVDRSTRKRSASTLELMRA